MKSTSTGSLSLERLKMLTESLCDRDEQFKHYNKYVKSLLKDAHKNVTQLKIKINEGCSEEEVISYIDVLLSKISTLQEKVSSYE